MSGSDPSTCRALALVCAQHTRLAAASAACTLLGPCRASAASDLGLWTSYLF